MKRISTLIVMILFTAAIHAQTLTPYQRVYQTLNTKCQNTNCHSATSSEALKFDGNEAAVYSAIYNKLPQNATSVSKSERQIRPGHPYLSFLLRKVAGAGFDADLGLEATEGDLMLDINGNQLTNKEIEFIRQWVMFGAKQTYTSTEPKPDWQLVSDYYDNPTMPFLPKPAKPAVGQGLQVRMGPVFLPVSGEIEQEWMLQQEVNFPVIPEVNRIEGIMNQQSHHFLLFQFFDSSAAAARGTNGTFGMKKVFAGIGGATSFDGDKNLTGAWQDDAELVLPTGTGLFWEKKAYLDMNYHIKNYNATSVLPCDFYFNIYYKQRNPNTIEMKSQLVNNIGLFLPQGVQTRDYNDQDNNKSKQWKYLWMISSHAHKYGTDYDIYVRDTTGDMSNKIYEGFYDYQNNFDKGYYDWEHPAIRYWDDLLPVKFGKHGNVNAGLVARTTWNVTEPFVTFGFTTNDEMQLFYYMYTSQPLDAATAINDDSQKGIYFQVFPNPMNSNGKLVYTLENNAMVKAEIIDATGKMVASLAEEFQQEGMHEINIGGTQNLSKGIYYAHLSIDGSVYTKKFIVTE
ncbi:MAG: T9SS type A sorting domain-containing protein [Chitinophagales bacterium]|nr:T9SS type A sorting domain-containing protein [Chitinophagales bacterium]